MRNQQQISTGVGRCQGWQLARERLLALLNRIRFSAFIGRDRLTDSELSRLEQTHKRTIDALLRVNKRIEQTSVITRTYHNLRCPRCRENSLSVTLKRGVITASKVVCHFCGFRVEVAKLNGAPLAKCPRCGYPATIAQGRREDGRVFFAFSCDRCGWVADDRFMSVSLSLLPH